MSIIKNREPILADNVDELLPEFNESSKKKSRRRVKSNLRNVDINSTKTNNATVSSVNVSHSNIPSDRGTEVSTQTIIDFARLSMAEHTNSLKAVEVEKCTGKNARKRHKYKLQNESLKLENPQDCNAQLSNNSMQGTNSLPAVEVAMFTEGKNYKKKQKYKQKKEKRKLESLPEVRNGFSIIKYNHDILAIQSSTTDEIEKRTEGINSKRREKYKQKKEKPKLESLSQVCNGLSIIEHNHDILAIRSSTTDEMEKRTEGMNSKQREMYKHIDKPKLESLAQEGNGSLAIDKHNHNVLAIQDLYLRNVLSIVKPDSAHLTNTIVQNCEKYFLDPVHVINSNKNEPPKRLSNGESIISITSLDDQIRVPQDHTRLYTPKKDARKKDTPKKKKTTPNEKVSNANNTTNEKERENFEEYISEDAVKTGLENETLVMGAIRINPKNYKFSFVSSPDVEAPDYQIEGVINRNRALEGDIVVIQKMNSDETGPDKKNTAKVVYIKQKEHPRICIGHMRLMPDRNREKAWFTPRDNRIPFLNIPFPSWPDGFYKDHKSFKNTLFSAKIIEWVDPRFAIGTIECIIGSSGELQAETKAILAENSIDVTPYGPEIRSCHAHADFVIPNEELMLREDCRAECIFTIDPSTARDLDDAVSCRELPNGNVEIGVHISDVSYFLTENTVLDALVSKKATTVYMVEKAYHMLPIELCMLCSLSPGKDKLAFSVFWEITIDGEILNHRFARTVINSCGQLAYEDVQNIIEDPGREWNQDDIPQLFGGWEWGDIIHRVKTLSKLSAIFRKQRFEGGALRIDQPKLSFRLDPSSGLPMSYSIYHSLESHQLIEEFMLLANMTVARRILEDHPKLAFLRNHGPPKFCMLKELAKSLDPVGINLDISSAGGIQRSMQSYIASQDTDIGISTVLNCLCSKPMTRADYFCASDCPDDHFWHYALNVPIYTHFTSPIRRYADIMVHRLLSASLKYTESPKWCVRDVQNIAQICNKQKYNAKKAGEASIEMYTLQYIVMNSPMIMQAAVVEVKDRSLTVIIIDMGLSRRVYFNNFKGNLKYLHNADHAKLDKLQLVWPAENGLPKTSQIIEIFSVVTVQMRKSDEPLQVVTQLVRPTIQSIRE